MIELDNRFTLPIAPDAVWRALSDVERIAPFMPGVTIESASGDEIAGSVKVKLAVTAVIYRWAATIVELDTRARRAMINTVARETVAAPAGYPVGGGRGGRGRCVGRGDPGDSPEQNGAHAGTAPASIMSPG